MNTQCIGITRQNKQCERTVKVGNRCYLHPEKKAGILYPIEKPEIKFDKRECPMHKCNKLEIWKWFTCVQIMVEFTM